MALSFTGEDLLFPYQKALLGGGYVDCRSCDYPGSGYGRLLGGCESYVAKVARDRCPDSRGMCLNYGKFIRSEANSCSIR